MFKALPDPYLAAQPLPYGQISCSISGVEHEPYAVYPLVPLEDLVNCE